MPVIYLLAPISFINSAIPTKRPRTLVCSSMGNGQFIVKDAADKFVWNKWVWDKKSSLSPFLFSSTKASYKVSLEMGPVVPNSYKLGSDGTKLSSKSQNSTEFSFLLLRFSS